TETAAAALARLYDLDLSDDPGDLDLYLALAGQTGGPILELAVGSGRLAVPLASAGYDVTGVDVDRAMLDRARAAAAAAGPATDARLTLLTGDARDVQLPGAGSFNLAFVPLNSLFIMGTRADQAAAVATLAAHLAPGGLAVVDCWLPEAEDLARYDGRVVLEWARTDPETGHTVTKSGSAVWDAGRNTVGLTTVFEAGPQGEPPVRWVRVDHLRLVSPEELTAMAEGAGLRVERLAGDYDLGPLERGSERVIVLARRP
ncbi:MAG TPA: class I SAM-dependent methyltransferase, partial [Candidatus Limnocylindrales bacterium]|nr:class I SAM-dependent methyltransferase [Candidatus Limnocylindrales bacterium]